MVPFTTAIGLTDAPCELVGHGWVTAAHARQIMLNDDSTWRRLAVDAGSGAAVHLETRAYRPTAAATPLRLSTVATSTTTDVAERELSPPF